MIITLICLVLFVAGIVLFIIGMLRDWAMEPDAIGVLFGVSLVPLMICLFTIASAQIGRDVKYEERLHERNMLEYRLEQAEEDNNVIEYAELYNDVVKFNNSIRRTKKWGNNPWTSWFFNPLIADLEYIEVTDMEDSK